MHILLAIFGRLFGNKKNILYILSKLSIYISAGISFAFLELYRAGNVFAILVDFILSHRFREAIYYFQQDYCSYLSVKSYSEFSSIQQLINKNLDNTFFYLTIRYGFVFLILFCIFFNLIYDYFKRQDNVIACEVLIAISFSIIVTNSITAYFLPFLVIASRELCFKQKSINSLKYRFLYNRKEEKNVT